MVGQPTCDGLKTWFQTETLRSPSPSLSPSPSPSPSPQPAPAQPQPQPQPKQPQQPPAPSQFSKMWVPKENFVKTFRSKRFGQNVSVKTFGQNCRSKRFGQNLLAPKPLTNFYKPLTSATKHRNNDILFYWTDSTEGALVTFARITLSSNLLRGLLFKRYKPSIYLNPRGAKGFRVLIFKGYFRQLRKGF